MLDTEFTNTIPITAQYTKTNSADQYRGIAISSNDKYAFVIANLYILRMIDISDKSQWNEN